MKKVLSLALLMLTVSLYCSCKKEDPAKIAVLSTTAVTNITATTATSGGTISSDGKAAITARGICWSTNADPSTSDSKTTDGDGSGQFASTLSGLVAGTTYHVRAYAANSVGTAYGQDITFTTLGQPPAATTQPVTNISASGATLNGTINANDLSTTVTFEYGTSTSYGQTATAAQSPVSGNAGTTVSSDITGLTSGVTYHVRIKAVNSLGTTYGEDLTFTTLGQSPTAITQAATNLSSSGATLNGTVNPNGSSTTVTFEYGTTTSYGQTATATQSPVTGSASSNVNAIITGLTQSTTYHFRIKAVNSAGTTYGFDMTFTTTGSVPAVATQAATNISASGAKLNGVVNANNLTTTVTFEYGLTSGYGQTASAIPAQVIGNVNLAVYVTLTGLTQGTTYHFRIKAVNSTGTSYGNDLTFTTTNTSQVADVDGNVYNTITIGTQVWLKENLRTTKYNDGTAIPNITDNTTWSATTTGAYSDYSNTSSNSTTYGRLYNFYVVSSANTKNVCPTGWHVPSNAEWTTLMDYLGGEAVAGGKMKETGTAHWMTPNTGATNETGFTALPGGYRAQSGSFGLIGNTGFWWSSTEGGTTFAYYRYMYYGTSNLNSGDNDKHGGLSARCLKN